MPTARSSGLHTNERAENARENSRRPPVLTSTVAAAEVDVYGRINVTLQNSDEAAGEQAELRNNSSRVGVKGETALSAGLKAIYQL
jgi:hypothetical protein